MGEESVTVVAGEPPVKEESIELYRITDLLLAAFLLIQEGIYIHDILVNRFEKHGKERLQRVFVLGNKSTATFKEWILRYHNDQVLVPPNEYSKKISDLRDLINQKFAN